MASDFTITFSPEAEAVLQRLRAAGNGGLARAIMRAHDYANQIVVGHIQSTRLSQRGPQTLGVVTNRLRGSLRASPAVIDGDTVVSGIGTNVRYMGPHEFGFRGTVQVKAHARRVATFEGRTISLADAKQIRGKKLKEKLHLGTQNVRAHSRNVNIPARAPIRTGIRERLNTYRDAIIRECQKELAA